MSSVDFAFLHGGGQGSWVWQETLDALADQDGGEHRRILALDVPGCGAKRQHPDVTLDNRGIARLLIEDIERAGFRDAILVGHSQAGQVLPFIAELRPDLLRRLVYISCSIPLPGQTVHDMIGTGLHGADPELIGWPYDPQSMALMDGFRLMFCNDMPDEQEAAFMAKLGQDSWPPKTYKYSDWALSGLVSTPSTFVICLKDNILPAPWQERLAERYQVERCVRIDAGHQVMNTRPHALAEVLRHEALA